MVEKKININVNTKDAEKGIDNVTDSIESASAATSGLTGQLDKMTGGLMSSFKGVVSGIKNGVKAMKSLKVAIAATGIGALVVAVGALTAAFRGSEEGQNKLARIMGVVGAITGNLVDLLADLGDAIISAFENPKESLTKFANAIKTNITNRISGLLNLLPSLGKAISLVFDGKFREAGKTAANAVGQVVLGVENLTDKVNEAGDALVEFGKQNAKEAKEAAKVADMRAKADKIERDLIVERSKLESQIAALRLKSRQEDEFTAEQRRQALLDAQELEDSLLEKETEYLTLRAEAQSLENTFARSNKENLDAEANAIAEVNRMNAARLNQQRQTQRELNRLNKEIEREQTAAAKEKTAAENEAAKAAAERAKAETDAKNKILEATLGAQNLEVMKAQQKYDSLIAEAKKYGLDETDLVKARNAEINKINKKYYDEDAKNKQAAEIAKLQIVAGALNGLGKLVGEQTEAGKAISAAEAIINTYTGATKALASAPPPFNFVAAAGVVASGIASVRQIYATDVPAAKQSSVSVGGKTIGGGGGTAYSRPTANIPRPQGLNANIGFDTSGANLGNQIAQSLQGQPMRAYVVNQDIQSTQKLDRKIEETATFG